ncbi:MAG: AAA family ATPase, partial [Candidatus Binatia bacterium]
MYVYKLTRIIFNDNTAIEPGNLTVIVGPNNSGKSRALKDIAAITTQSRRSDHPAPSVVVNEAEWPLPRNFQEVLDAYNFRRYRDHNGIWIVRALYPELCKEYIMTSRDWQAIETQYSRMELEQEKRHLFISEFGQGLMGFLTTENRLQLVQESSSPSHELEEANLLQALYYGRSPLEKSIREVVKRAFVQEIALDFTVPQRLRLRVGNDFSELPTDPRDAAPIVAQYEKLDEQGDGIRSFVGIVTAILVSKRSVFLIDEPEAFLHPPHAFRIGEFLAT